MTSTSATPVGSSKITSEHGTRAATGHFMLTLCRLPAPVSIRPPQSPQLKPFTFFTTREREPDGSESVYLHMGFFEALADAERWVTAVHGRFPNAIATVAPATHLRPSGSKVPPGESADGPRGVPQSTNPAPVEDSSLTDTQVLRILNTRGVAQVQDNVDASNHDGIALLRPDDTNTRRALKEAVVQGAPVSFAVQLHWSAQPIDLSHVPSLAVFKAYTLYSTESRREGRSRYFLRLGFFGDPISAKEVAVQVRSNFAAAAVVPVAEAEVTRAREAVRETAAIPYLGRRRVGPTLDSSSTAAPRESRPSRDARHSVSRADETLEQTLERLAEREIWTDPDSLSETGVRHLRVDEVKEHNNH
jgi:hypothetical protein